MYSTILLRRSANLATAANVQLRYGEPLYTDDQYMTVGNGNESLTKERNVLRFLPKGQVDSQLFYTVNSEGKIVINTSDGANLTPVLTFGKAAERDVATSAVKNSADLITSGAVKTIQDSLQTSIKNVDTKVKDLEKSVSAVKDKSLDTTVTPTSENPVTAKAVYDFVTRVVNEAIESYVPWTTDSTKGNKLYINSTSGLQYRPSNQWLTVPVGYT